MTDIHAVIAELKALEAKATPRRGTYYFMGDDCTKGMCAVALDDAYPGLEGCYAPICDAQREDVGVYIAGALNALPQLLAYIEKLEAVRKAAQEGLDGWPYSHWTQKEYALDAALRAAGG